MGTIQPVEEICRGLAGLDPRPLVLVDAAQSAGVLPIDVEKAGIDLLAVPGHKSLYGPQGTGFLYVAPDVELTPLVEGGTGGQSTLERQPATMPERLESGTPNTPGIVALGEAVRYIAEKGYDQIRSHENALMQRLAGGLSGLDGVTMHGPGDISEAVGVLSFNIKGMDPAEVGSYLEDIHNIQLRVGLHCSPLSHEIMGTFPQGTVRVGPGIFNTADDMDRLLEGVRELLTLKGRLGT
jgi:selenocysteine lyase/cysteine desulfurase